MWPKLAMTINSKWRRSPFWIRFIAYNLIATTGWAKRTGPVWVLITKRWLVVRSHVIRQKFQNAVKKKRQIWIVKHLNILCLICLNIRHPDILWNLTVTHGFNMDIWAFMTWRHLLMEKRVICQKFWNCVQKKCTTCMSLHLNILCLIYTNLSHP